MKFIKQLIRLIYINKILSKYSINHIIISFKISFPIRLLIYLNPLYWFEKRKINRGKSLRKALEELGPIFIKFGQTLSTRIDILPKDIIYELCKLQNTVTPFSSEQAINIIESSLNCSINDIFSEFNKVPLASASIAQVHAAKLKNGKETIIKIVRPNIEHIIQQDLQIMYTIANIIKFFCKNSKYLKPIEIVKEFESSLLNEIDLRKEAANAYQLRKNFIHSTILYIPKIFWKYTKKNILVMERIYGISIIEKNKLIFEKVNIKQLIKQIIEIFFTQVFRDCFFHADMHPGNIFISFKYNKLKLIFIDFGVIGTLNDFDKYYLIENLYAFLNKDYYKVAELHIESGWIDKNTKIEDFANAICTIFEPILEKSVKHISFTDTLLNLHKIARKFHLELQPQLILLQKTLFSIEGISRNLYSNLDLWEITKPCLKKWIKEQINPKYLIKQFKKNLPYFLIHISNIPRLIQCSIKPIDKQLEYHNNKINEKKVFHNFYIYKLKIFIFGILFTICLIKTINILKIKSI